MYSLSPADSCAWQCLAHHYDKHEEEAVDGSKVEETHCDHCRLAQYRENANKHHEPGCRLAVIHQLHHVAAGTCRINTHVRDRDAGGYQHCTRQNLKASSATIMYVEQKRERCQFVEHSQ